MRTLCTRRRAYRLSLASLLYTGLGITASYTTVVIGSCWMSRQNEKSVVGIDGPKTRSEQSPRVQWFWAPAEEGYEVLTTRTVTRFAWESEMRGWVEDTRGSFFDVYYQSRVLAGWPIRATEARFDLYAKNPTFRSLRIDGVGTFRLSWSPTPLSTVLTVDVGSVGTSRTIPLCPRFPGALLNATFWGGIGFVTVSIVRRLRSRSGACPTCDYQVNDLARCPECGSETLAAIRKEAPCSAA
jgi:hypothetical protein